MTDKISVIQSLVYKNSKAIVLPPWVEGEAGYGKLAHPDVYVLDTTQKYPIGTKFIDGDKVFHYGYMHTIMAGVTANRSGMALCNIAIGFDVTTDEVEHCIGETEIVIEDTDPDTTLNQWAGGSFAPMSAPYGTGYRILSNTASDTEHFTITLERGLIVAVGTSTGDCRLNANQYSKLCNALHAGKDFVSFMGVSLIVPVASRWQWIQTWGPCHVIGGDEVPGSSAYKRMVQWGIDGTPVWDAAWDATNAKQLAGYVIESTKADSTWNAGWYFYLMMAP